MYDHATISDYPVILCRPILPGNLSEKLPNGRSWEASTLMEPRISNLSEKGVEANWRMASAMNERERAWDTFLLASIEPKTVPPRRLLWYDAQDSNPEKGVHTDVRLATACFNDVLYPVQPTTTLRR